MHKRIARLGAIFTAAFVLLVANLTYLQFIAASDLTAKTENIRPILNEQKIRRGNILSADGELLASSQKTGDVYKRYYPKASLLAPVTGFYSTRYGRAGLELTHDEYLSGQTKAASIDDYVKRLLGKDVPGNDLTLTIDADIQKTASEALGSRKGAAVALNPKTGAVLALVSRPSYDPNTVDADWDSINSDPDGVMVNRALQGRFTPGSSFKIITAAAAIEDGLVSTDTVLPAPAQLKIYGGKVTNYANKGYGELTLSEAFAKSVNTVFAGIGKNLGGQKLVASSEAFGFNIRIPFDLPAAMSHIPAPSEMDDLEVAWTAVGQGKLLASPFNMALAGAAIANDGKIMQPYLVEEVREHDGSIVFKRNPKVWREPVSKETARIITSFMVKTVSEGTGRSARIDSVSMAGKTGTAEVGSRPPHAWFVGFAPAEDPQVVVAVVIESGGSGGREAAPVAKKILLSALGKNR